MWEDRVVGRSIRMRAARHVVEKMLEAAMNSPEDPDDPLSSRLAFAVVDTFGSLVYFARMNAGGPLNSKVAINKAYSCLYGRQDTFDQMELLHKIGHDIVNLTEPRLSLIPGGVLIRDKEGAIVGAIGISGRPALDPMGDVELGKIGAQAYLDYIESNED